MKRRAIVKVWIKNEIDETETIWREREDVKDIEVDVDGFVIIRFHNLNNASEVWPPQRIMGYRVEDIDEETDKALDTEER